VALVVAGGTLGTALRAWAASAYPIPAGGFPWTTLVVNVTGALLLGLLLEILLVLGHGRPGARALQWAFGTGLLGGFTTYSTFVLETIHLGTGGQLRTALLYAAASLITGFAAAWLAMNLVRRLSRGARGSQRPGDRGA
jgi:CrcB protein